MVVITVLFDRKDAKMRTVFALQIDKVYISIMHSYRDNLILIPQIGQIKLKIMNKSVESRTETT